MTLLIIDPATAAAVAAATTQEDQRAALLAPWADGNVTARVMAGATLLATLTQGPFTLGATTPRRATLGARQARSFVAAGIPTRVVFRAASVDVFELSAGVGTGDVSFAAAVTEASRERLDGLVITAAASLPVVDTPPPTTYLLTFAADDTATVNEAAAGSITNTGTGACAWSITPPSNVTVTPSSGTLAAGGTQALSITATTVATHSLTLVSVGTTITGNPQAIVASPASATVVTLGVPSSGSAGVPATVTVTPNGPIPPGGGTVTLATTAGTLASTTLTFAAGATAAQTTTLTLASTGSATVTMSNSMGLTNSGSPAAFTAAASTGYFASVVLDSTDTFVPSNAPGQTVIVELHGSGTAYSFFGDKWNANLAGGLEYDTDTVFKFAIAIGSAINGNAVTMVRPWDRQGTFPDSGLRRESYWMGWTDGPEAEFNLYTERRLDAMIAWIKANQANLSATKWALTGGSMGAWGTLTYGIRRPHIFPGLWPDRPRWRNAEVAGTVRVPSWTQPPTPSYAVGASPAVRAADGGGTSAAHLDVTSYVANADNAIPWVGWHIGKQDGYMPWQDHVDAIAALRATGRGFAVYWNNDGHSISSAREAEIRSTYPMGLFELGKGYPVFSEHSLDNDPVTDLVGGINVGLTFRNVVETASTWSCEVRYMGTASRPQQACTVKVKPKSSVYTGDPMPQLVNVPAAGAWVTVSF